MIYKGIDEELMVIPCMNNKVLFLNMSNIEDITLSDFDADTEDIFQLLNTSVFYYLDGRKKSTIIDFYQDSDDIIETIEMVYGYDFTDIEQNFMFYIDAHDETENFVNLKGISMMELPLLKVEEEIFRRNDQ